MKLLNQIMHSGSRHFVLLPVGRVPPLSLISRIFYCGMPFLRRTCLASQSASLTFAFLASSSASMTSTVIRSCSLRIRSYVSRINLGRGGSAFCAGLAGCALTSQFYWTISPPLRGYKFTAKLYVRNLSVCLKQ